MPEALETTDIFSPEYPVQFEPLMVRHLGKLLQGIVVKPVAFKGELTYNDPYIGIRYGWKPYTSPLTEASDTYDGIQFRLAVTLYDLKMSEIEAHGAMADLLDYFKPSIVILLGLNESHHPTSYSTSRCISFGWRDDIQVPE